MSAAGLIRWSCAVLSVIGLLYAIAIGLHFRGENRTLLDEALQPAQRLADEVQAQIEGTLRRVAETIDAAAENLLKAGTPDEPDLLAAIRDMMYADPGFVEAGVAFAPFAYDPKMRLYGLSYVADEGGMRLRDLDLNQDYTKPGADWYHRSLEGTAVWLEPRYDKVRGQTLVTYTAPLFKPGGPAEPLGVVYATYAVSRVQRVLDALDLGENGYSFLLSSGQRFILHPNNDYIVRRQTLDDLQSRLTDASAGQAVGAARRDPSQIARFTDPDTGLDSRVFFRQIPAAAWTLGLVLIDRDLQMPPAAARSKLIRLVLVLGLSVVLLVVPLSGLPYSSTRGFWILSSVFAVCCILATGFVLGLAMNQPPANDGSSLRITTRNILNRFMSDQRRRTLAQREEVPLFIPTGIYVQSISLATANDVRMTGYLWQRYTDRIHGDVERGFVMPESKSFEIDEPYTTRVGNTELVRWNFKATLRQHFDYTRYPFGSENVRVQLWHREFTRNVILVPDLESYKLMNPAAGSGLAQDLQLSGWDIEDSFFSYRLQSYKTSFGLKNYAGLTDFPELFFNIGIRKQITGPFVSNILPLIVVSIMLFGVVFLCTREGGRKGLLGFTLDVIIACAAFFIVVIFSHIALRRSLGTRDIFYLEYYYFVTYAMILFVTMNYVHFTKTPIRLLQYRDNFIAKVIYWPVSQLALLVLTLREFY
ncbi:MAG: cache domain-containing protein [Gammaproteobacteria bacterium]